jgi:hypothetical protein
MINGLTFVESAHFDGIFDRFTLAVDLERSVAALCDRNHAMVDLWRELAIYPDLFVAGGFPLRKRRIIKKGKADGALDLQRAVAFQKHRRRVGIDAMNTRMRRGIGQECEDALLHAGVGCG